MSGHGLASHTRMAFRLALVTSVAGSGLLVSGAAFAQDDSSAIANDEPGFGAIIVTAQRREENQQDVPIAITALNEKKVEVTGFDEVGDLAKSVPSFAVGTFGPVAFSSLRGVGFENTTAGGDPSVTFHFDDVNIGRPVGSLFSAFDTERVEVLRGPQGTLYGRNATGGSINLITKKPEDYFSGSFDAQYGNYESFRLRGAINVPLADGIATRIVGFVQGNEGFTENAFPGGTRGNQNDAWGIRGHIGIEPSPDFELLLSGNYIDTSGTGAQAELREPFSSTIGLNFITPAGQTGPLIDIPPFGSNVNDLRPFRESVNTPQTSDNSFLLLSANAQLHLGNITIKSITGYVETKFNSRIDSDGSPVNILDLILAEEGTQFTQELQIQSDFSGPFNFILGAFYFEEEASRTSLLRGDPFDPVAEQFNLPAGVVFAGDVESQSIAGFVHLDYELSSRLKLTAGARLTRDEKEGTNTIISTAFGGPPFALTPFNSLSTTEPSWRISLDYRVNPDFLAYGSYARGYKSGGINGASAVSNVPGISPPTGPNNQGVPPTPGQPTGTYEPEFIDTFEIGFKSQLFDNNLLFNAAAFYSDYRDLQFQVFNPTPVADNAGSAEIFGFEIDFQALVGDSLELDGSLGYLDATYTELLITTPGGIVDLSGNRLNRAPEWAGSLGATYYLPVPDSFGEVFLRGDFSYKGAQFFRPNNVVPDDRTDDYTNVDLRLFWKDPNRIFTVELFATNLFDTTQEVNILRGLGPTDEPGGGGQELVAYAPPRQYGVRVGVEF